MIRKWVQMVAQIAPEKPKPDYESTFDSVAPLDAEIEIFDFKRALHVFMDDRDTLLSVLSEFVKRTADQLDAFPGLLEDADFKTCGLHAHTIKGSSWNLGITQLGNAAHKLELACKAQNRQEALQCLPEFRDSWAQFVKLSQKYLRN